MHNINFNIPIHFTNRQYHQYIYIICVQANNNSLRSSVVAAWSRYSRMWVSQPEGIEVVFSHLVPVGPQNAHIVTVGVYTSPYINFHTIFDYIIFTIISVYIIFTIIFDYIIFTIIFDYIIFTIIFDYLIFTIIFDYIIFTILTIYL